MVHQHDPTRDAGETGAPASGVSVDGHAATLGERIRQMRIAQGRSLRALAGGTLSASLVSRIERNLAAPSLDTLRYLAAQLGCSPGYLLTEKEQPVAQGPHEAGDVFGALLGLLNRALDANMSVDGVVADAPGGDPSTGDASALVDLAIRGLRETEQTRGRETGPTSPAHETTGGQAKDQTLADGLRERVRAACADARRASACGASMEALLAAGRGFGLIESYALCQTSLDDLLKQVIVSGATDEQLAHVVMFVRASGFVPDTRSTLDLAEQALEQGQMERCSQFLDPLTDEQVQANPRARRMRAHLAFGARDVSGAVAQWTQLADDTTVPAEFAVDTLLEAGMLLDEAQHAPEAQVMYHRAAVLWQQLGPRSSVTSSLPAPGSLVRGGVTRGDAERGHAWGGGETRETRQEHTLRQGRHQH